jgi:hypothetical protein
MSSWPPPNVAETCGHQCRLGFVTRALDHIFRVHELGERYSRRPTCLMNVGEVIVGDDAKAVGWADRERTSILSISASPVSVQVGKVANLRVRC